MKIDPSSALFGGTFAGLLVLAMGARGASAPRHQFPLALEQTVKIKGIPAPEDMVRIVEGSPFVVPVGRIFVATGVGMDGEAAPGRAWILFDGVAVYFKQWRNVVGTSIGFATAGSIPAGLTAPAGTVVTVDNNLGSAFRSVLLGYLADADS